VVLICSTKVWRRNFVGCGSLVDTPSLEILAFGSDHMLQDWDQTPWLGCFLFAVALADHRAKIHIKFLKVLAKCIAIQLCILAITAEV
jgi:hypothetical protein